MSANPNEAADKTNAEVEMFLEDRVFSIFEIKETTLQSITYTSSSQGMTVVFVATVIITGDEQEHVIFPGIEQSEAS